MQSGTASVNMDSQWGKQVLFCKCDWSVACYQLHHQCHFWRKNLMFEAYNKGKRAWQLSIKFMSFMRPWTVVKIRFIKGLLWKFKYSSATDSCLVISVITDHQWYRWKIVENQHEPFRTKNYLHSKNAKHLSFYFPRQVTQSAVVIPLRQFGSHHPLWCYSKITFK